MKHAWSHLPLPRPRPQEVEYVKPEARVVYILECLKKTPPPVLIFAEKKQDVDAIQEYLLLKGVQAVATHGGKGRRTRGGAEPRVDTVVRGVL